MQIEKTFKTKTGFCHILPDKIILSSYESIEDATSKKILRHNISLILIIYGILNLEVFYFAFEKYRSKQSIQSILFVFIGLYLSYAIISSIKNSAPPIIDRKKIKNVKFKKGFPGLTRSRFEVIFENEKGKIKKRLIMLPGTLTGGQNETQKALKIMVEEKIIMNY